MNRTYSHKVISFLLTLVVLNSFAQQDTLFVDANFKSIDLGEISKSHHSVEPVDFNNAYIHSEFPNKKSHLFVNLKNNFSVVFFTIKNKEDKLFNAILELNNSLINHVELFEKTDVIYRSLNKTGTDFSFNTRMINDRKIVFPIDLKPNDTKQFALSFKNNKISLVIPAKLWSKKSYENNTTRDYLVIGLYYGISLISILFSLYIFGLLKQRLYLIYALYILSLGLYLFSFLGLFFQYFIDDQLPYNKYFHVFFAVCTTVCFVIFSQNILKAKTYAPKIKKTLDILLIIVIITRFSDFILPDNMYLEIKPFVMRLWYFSFFVIITGLVGLIVKSYYYQKRITLFYTLAFSFISIATIITIISVTTGALSGVFYGLPVLLYASFIEIIFLTFAIVLKVKGIYDDRNYLSRKLVHEQRSSLNSFIKGENNERKRISKELHDNIGSKLSYLKRFISDTFNDVDATNAIDELCVDVRNLSHEISPSDLNLVGFKMAVSELAQNISNKTSLQVSFNSYQFPATLSEVISLNLYRVVQESLNNIIKHAEAKHVDIQLIGHDNHFTISVEDDGKGFNYSEKEGIGIKNMNSRILDLKGTFSIDSQINKGTSILINIPI